MYMYTYVYRHTYMFDLMFKKYTEMFRNQCVGYLCVFGSGIGALLKARPFYTLDAPWCDFLAQCEIHKLHKTLLHSHLLAFWIFQAILRAGARPPLSHSALRRSQSLQGMARKLRTSLTTVKNSVVVRDISAATCL